MTVIYNHAISFIKKCSRGEWIEFSFKSGLEVVSVKMRISLIVLIWCADWY